MNRRSPAYRMTTEIHPTQTKPQEPTLGMRERDFYIDCLRSVMIGLVVLQHTAITYGASGGWVYHELRPSGAISSEILTLFTGTNQAYFMGFLFLLAGYFTPGSLERKGYARFLSDRFLRLGLPLLAFGFVLGPLTVAMVTAAAGGHQPTASRVGRAGAAQIRRHGHACVHYRWILADPLVRAPGLRRIV